MLREKLGVTDDQLEKMKPIFEQQREKLTALKDDTATPVEQKREKAIGIFTETMEELKPILTPEQFAKFKEEMEKRRAARQQKPEEGEWGWKMENGQWKMPEGGSGGRERERGGRRAEMRNEK